MSELRPKTVFHLGLLLSLCVGLTAQSSEAQPTLYLPFPAGKTHTVTQYPHDLGSPYMGWAMDIGMNLNDQVLASAAGVVRTAGSVNNYDPSINGNQVIIDHGNNFCTQYNHLNWVNVRVGDTVGRGHLLGGAGQTGLAYGVHLHWNTIYCSGLTTRGPITTAEYPNGFYVWQPITSKNSTGLPYGLKGAIGARWEDDGGLAAWGKPLGPEGCGLRDGGCYQPFEKGRIYWAPDVGAWGTRGAILRKYAAIGYENSKLGYPTWEERCGLSQGGCYQAFQHGRIHWFSGQAHAYYTAGAIGAKWKAMGSEHSFLQYPTMDPRGGLKNGGYYQRFQGGSIHWSSASGAHPTKGAIQEYWGTQDYENGWLGYPTSSEYKDASGNTVQNFQGGKVYWASGRGTWSTR